MKSPGNPIADPPEAQLDLPQTAGGQGDTIAAIATAIVPQQGSVGIVRLSGVTALAIAKAMFRAPGQQPWESHRILYGFVTDPATGHTVDEALLLLMLAPRSYTREDVVEVHCHGGVMAVQQVLQVCLNQGGGWPRRGNLPCGPFSTDASTSPRRRG